MVPDRRLSIPVSVFVAILLVISCSDGGSRREPLTTSGVSSWNHYLPIRETVVPATLQPVGCSDALFAGPRPTDSIEALAMWHVACIHTSTKQPQPWARTDRLLETPYLHINDSPKFAMDFAAKLPELLTRLEHFRNAILPSPRCDLRERVLYQRDLHQMRDIMEMAQKNAANAEFLQRIAIAQSWISEIMHATALDEADIAALDEIRRAGWIRAQAENPWRTDQEYLPKIAFGNDPSWVLLPSTNVPTDHFMAYGARSFISIYMRIPGMTGNRFSSYWSDLYERYGENLVRNPRVPQLPAKSETLLVRTCGAFTKDGLFFDTGIPEEILIRSFITSSNDALVPQSTDGFGTYTWQYKLSHTSFRSGTGVLGTGLTRVHDKEPQFWGFYGDSPDLSKGNYGVSTMANNCYQCHSDPMYGISTIYSLSCDPRNTSMIHYQWGSDSSLTQLDERRYRLVKKSLP